VSASLNTPGARRHQAIRDSLEDLGQALEDLREVRPQINDLDLLGRLEAFIAAAGAMLEEHGQEPGPSLPAQARSLRDGISQMAIPSRDPELGRTETLRRLQSAEGLFAARLDRLRKLLPETPQTSEMAPRAETGQMGELIEARLQSLEASLRALRAADHDKPGLVQQTGLINLYIKEANTEISLARFLAKIGETKIDLGAIQAAAQRLAELTKDFLSMVAGWAGRVSDWLPPLGERLRRGAAGVLKAVALGWKVVGWRRNAQSGIGAVPDPDEVRRRLLAGEALPANWLPRIMEVDLSRSDFAATERLAGLVNLESLNLLNTAVTDIASLSSLAKLQSLRLGGIEVAEGDPEPGSPQSSSLILRERKIGDFAPLAMLVRLRSLTVTTTSLIDLTPLASLTALEVLDLGQNKIVDITPLSSLHNLQFLSLWRTLVSDLSPIMDLKKLRHLNLQSTRVHDLKPLSELANLEGLDIIKTQVTDITSLSVLPSLKKLFVSSYELPGFDVVRKRDGLVIHVHEDRAYPFMNNG
jgi:hypothetical protein